MSCFASKVMGLYVYGQSTYQVGGCIGSHYNYSPPEGGTQLRVIYRGEVGGWLVFSPVTEPQKEIYLSFEVSQSNVAYTWETLEEYLNRINTPLSG